MYDGNMLVLASQSPRRAEILKQAGIPFEVQVPSVDESPLEDELPEDYVQRLAESKALAVWFAPMTAREIDDYVASGEPRDKAGAYAIQGRASKFIEKIEGCYFNVVGLPVALVYRHLRGRGR